MSKQESKLPGAVNETPYQSDLDHLRQQIDAIDNQIVELLAQRRRTVEKVIQVKQQHDLPTFHPAREENLISARRKQAEQAGLDPDYVEDLFRTVMRHSRVGQLTTLGRRGVRPGAKVLIIGGRGKMGRFFAQWFGQSDYDIRILDQEDWPQAPALFAGIDLCLLAVPISDTPSVAAQVACHLPQGCILADITSLKNEPLQAMMNAYSGPVVGLHPLFGPATTSMDKQIVAVTPGRQPEACKWLLDQLTIWGNVLVETSAEEHDEIMSIVQALRHYATFAFGHFLCSKEIPILRTLELSSPIYRLELAMVGRLFAQDPELYADIIFATPERIAMLKEFVGSLNENLDMIAKGNKDDFSAQFQKVADWFGPFSEQALRESTFLVEKLVHRF